MHFKNKIVLKTRFRQVTACESMCSLMREIGVAIDGGKDSLSMAARVDGKTVKAPGSLVVSAYVTVNDVTKKVTPELKVAPEIDASKTALIHVDLSQGETEINGHI